MARGLNVSIGIGARIGSSVNAAAAATERRFAQMSRRIKVTGAEIKATLKGIEEAQSRRRNKLFEGAAFAFGASRAVKPFVDFEDALVRMGNTAEVHGRSLDKIGAQVIKVGAQYAYGGSEAIVGANDYVAAGMKLNDAMAALPSTLKLAKTAGVEIGEASQSGIALMQNLGVEAGQIGLAFDIMAKAGKEGRFEINDMARALPGLSSRAALLGMKGLDGVKRMSAMLQITRTNARDAEEAENNLLNFLDKLTGNETIQHFDKLGVSIETMLKKSKKNGTDFVDDMLDEIGRLTKNGTDAIALTKLFPDRQARQGVLALITQRKELERIRKVTGGRGTAGTLDRDFQNISKTSKFGLGRAAAGLERIGIAFGRAFGPALGVATEKFAALAERFANWADKNPTVVKNIGLLAAGFVGLRTAFAGLGLIFGSGISRIARLFGGKLVGLVTRGFGAIFTVGGPILLNGLMRLAPLLLRGLGLAFGVLTGPVGWAILAASAAALVWKFRDQIGVAWTAVTTWFRTKAWPMVRDTITSINWSGIGMQIADALTFGLASKAANMGAAIGRAITGSTPATAGKKLPGRAKGGSVSAGKAYMVGENGPEPFVPGRSGTIIPAHVAKAAMSGGGAVTQNFHISINGANDPQATARAVRDEFKRIAKRSGAMND